MGDDERGAIGRDGGQRPLDGRLGLVVDRRRGLVEHQEAGSRRIARAMGDPLALAAGELLAALADDRVVAVGRSSMKSWASASRAASLDLGVGGVGPAVGEVLADRAVEEEDVLADEADRPAQRAAGQVADVDAVEQDAPPAGRRGAAAA